MISKAYVMPHPPLIVPQVGRGQEKKIQKTIDAFDEAAKRIVREAPQTVVIITPHSVMYGDYIHISPGIGASGSFGCFGAKDVSIYKDYDTDFSSELAICAGEADINAGMMGERDATLDHATLVPLYFINKYTQDYRIVRISVSGLSYRAHYELGKCIAQSAQNLNRKTVVVASGDLSHKLTEDGPYGYAEQGPAFDAQLTDALKQADFLKLMSFDESFCEAAAECGLRSFVMMAGALDGKSLDTDFMSYEGPFGVGYAVCEYSVSGDDENRRFGKQYAAQQTQKIASIQGDEDEFVKLARLSLETYVKTREYVDVPKGLAPELTHRKAGVFVSLKMHGRLRGCIGTTSPAKDSIAQEIIANAVSSGTGDPRFDPVSADELADLVYSVDVLGEAEPISSMDELDEKRYGVIVKKGFRSGLLLPNLDGVDTPDEQVKIALQKAGIDARSKYEMQRFEVVRHK
ncbi:MAG: AmmeMemoRadiSam system protein A [Clostridia bacterium]|jgi:MEMO1 family protein|nr:AmmeMemoRadiSam system protein A [Clostridia bacterium]MBT7121945.1 AmmeMemoRadiSam system protein A [Clostridia bacterium]